MMPDPFEVLDLRPGATQEEVRAAYLRLAKLVHPDRFALDPPELRDEAARRMTELNVAHEAALASFGRRTSGPSMCARCEPPSNDATSFRCGRCKTWWDATNCMRCGRAGMTVGGAGAPYTCRACALDANPAKCPRCWEPAGEVTPEGFTCRGCGTAWRERGCAYCGVPAFLEQHNAAFTCASCRFANLAIRRD